MTEAELLAIEARAASYGTDLDTTGELDLLAQAAGDRGGGVDDENFAMIPDGKMAETDRVKNPDGAAGIFQFLPVARGQGRGADPVDEDVDPDATGGGAGERGPKTMGNGVIAPDVGFAADGGLGGAGEREDPGVGGGAGR